MMFGYFCVEDPLSRAVIQRLIRDLIGEIHLTELLPNQGGFGSMKNKFGEYCTLAQHQSVFILTDLDNAECAPSLRADWMNGAGLVDPLPEKMHFRVAVREVEAWLLADRDNVSEYLGLPPNCIPENTDIPDPKEHLLDCVRRHGNATARSELLPEGAARVGLGYNYHLSKFASEHWDIQRAASRNSSLSRAVHRLVSARPA